MAEEEKVEETSGNSNRLIIIIGLIVILIGGGAAAYLLLAGNETEEETTTEKTAPEKVTKQPLKSKAIYHALKEPLVVNFTQQSAGQVKYLQIKLKVMVRDQQILDAFVLHLPAIRHELLLLYFSQNYDTLNTKEGARELRQHTLDAINSVLGQQGLIRGIESVYFTSFIMQ
ncbi:MAG TPA: flagellar basal body protein FliL [Gammaproteobacteria bacterium]|nr:flagellar basal body protein FliL [Gammaproteobacteria bacterium]